VTDPASYDTVVPATREERTYSLIAHLGGPVGVLLSVGLFGFLVPLVVWLAKRDESTFVAHHASEALNFQLTLLVVSLGAWMFVLFTLGLGFLVIWPLFLVLWFGELILGIVAALRAHDGKHFRYPCIVRFIQ
jgi:uncharacterized Tic20 family protein